MVRVVMSIPLQATLASGITERRQRYQGAAGWRLTSLGQYDLLALLVFIIYDQGAQHVAGHPVADPVADD